jgi:GAF domain-containing protein
VPTAPTSIADRDELLDQRTRERDEALEQQAATSEVLSIIRRSPTNAQPVFDAIVESAARLCGAIFSISYLYDGDHLRVAATKGFTPAATRVVQHNQRKPQRSHLGGRAILDRAVVHVPDVLADPEYSREYALAGGWRAVLAVPLLRDGVPLGALSVAKAEPTPFSDRQIQLLKTFADQAVIAIENTRLVNELRESLQQQTATADVLKVISRSTFDLKAVLNTLAESATRLCEADGTIIWRPKDGRYKLAACYGLTPEFEADMQQVALRSSGHSVVGRAVHAKKTVHIPDMLADPEYVAHDPDPKRVGGYRAMLGVPLMREGVPIGVMMVGQQTPKAFTEANIALVTTFADQAVIAIENVRLFDEVQARTREVAESLQQQTATAEVLKIISRSTFDLQVVLKTLVDAAARLCAADQAVIMRPGKHEHSFYVAASHGHSSESIDYLSTLTFTPGREGVVGRVLLERKPVQIADVLSDPDFRFHEVQRRGGFRTLLGLPLLREGNPIGILAVSRSTVQPFDDKHIELLTSFADQAVIAIENVRLFESVETRTRELAKSLEELRTTQDRLVQTQKLALLGQLTAGIAHEIKNPLNFVNNFSGVSAELIGELQDALKNMPLDDKARADINELAGTLKSNFDKVVHHGRRADAIVKNMLQHSREGSGEHRVVAINGLVEESLNLAWHGARAETQGFEIKLKQSFDPSAGEADVFPQDIRRALLNMISNGFYAATKRRAEINGGDYEPTVTASTKSLGDRVEIRIRDNGTGMPPDVKEKMFNPFFTTKPTGEGTGLGLSISHDIIVKQHGGSIEVDTQPGEFTEISIILPRAAVFV